MDSRAHHPKILELSELALGEHRVAFVRDFRERFALSVADIGLTIRYDEAWDLCLSLVRDSTTWLHASFLKQERPHSHEEAATWALIDVLRARWMKDPTPAPKPWRSVVKKATTRLSPAEAWRRFRPGKFKK